MADEPGTFSGATSAPVTPSTTPDQVDNGGYVSSNQILAPQGPQAVSSNSIMGTPPAPGAISSKALLGDSGPSMGKDLATSVGIDPKTYDAIARPAEKVGSMVATATAPLAWPLRAETGAIMGAAQLLGVPGAKEWNQKFNPNGKLMPDAYISDITDFYIDKASQGMGLENAPDMMRNAVTGTKFMVGLGANILMDPLMAMKFGGLTAEAENIKKIGGTMNEVGEVERAGLNSAAAKERNLVSIQTPGMSGPLEIKAKPVQDAISKLGETPPVKALSSAIKLFSPDTGNEELDLAGRMHDDMSRGDPVDVTNRYMVPKKALNMTADEDRVASALVESTPNLKPNLPEEHLLAGEKKAPWADEASLRRSMGILVEDKAKALGVELPPGREDAIVEAAVLAKKAGAENLEDKFNAGTLTAENIQQKIIPSHLKHAMNPAYEGVKDLPEYLAKLNSDEKEVQKVTGGSFLSSKDITEQRTVQGTLEEANAKLLAQKGLDNFFINDPVAAQTGELIKSKRLLRDSQYLDTVKSYGQKMERWDAIKAGMVPIDHPELSGRAIALPNKVDSTQPGKVLRLGDLYYPKDIASKVQYRVAKPPLTGALKALSDYNKVFRSMIFMSSPGIRIGNTLDNIFKTIAVTGKDFMQASKDATSVLLGKSEGFRSAPTSLRPNGVFYDGQALKSLIDKYGFTKTGAWSEGMEAFMDAGKKLSLRDAMQRPGTLVPKMAMERAKNMVRWVDTFGEHGENSAKVALFMQRLRAGFEPDMAANEVTKWLFDYNRNSPMGETARLVLPFIQHPMKTAMIAPALLGTAPGAYNFIQNTFPKVLANAFHDPMTQAELSTILPPNIRQRDGVVGPFIPGNTWMGAIFGSKDPKLGSAAWFDPRIGMRILNHFDYLSKGGTDRLVGESSPVIQALMAGTGRGDWGKSLDYANGNINIANRVSAALSKFIGGVSPFPNAEKMLMQHFGLVDPNHVEPASVLVMKGLAGQFGGITDLDKDVQAKLISTHYAYMDQKKQFMQVAAKESKDLRSSTLPDWVKNAYPNLTKMSSVDLYQQMNQSAQEGQEAITGAQALGKGMTAGDFAVRMKSLADTMKQLNQAYQVLGIRKLQMKSK